MPCHNVLSQSKIKTFFAFPKEDKIIAVGNTKIVMNDGSIISGNKIIYKIKSEEFSIKGNGIFNNKRLKVEGENIDGVFIKINNETK